MALGAWNLSRAKAASIGCSLRLPVRRRNLWPRVQGLLSDFVPIPNVASCSTTSHVRIAAAGVRCRFAETAARLPPLPAGIPQRIGSLDPTREDRLFLTSRTSAFRPWTKDHSCERTPAALPKVDASRARI